MRYKLIGKVRQKEVLLTPHAEERSGSRRISVEEILSALRLNQINLPGKEKTRKILGTVGKRRIMVYIEETSGEIVVTTVVAPDEE